MSMRNNSRVKVINPSLLPSVMDAVQEYQQAGGHLRDPHQVGMDPLSPAKQKIRKQAFSERYTSFQAIFSALVNGDSTMFRNALRFYIDVTYRLSSSL